MLVWLAHFVSRHRRVVIGVCVALTLFGVFAASQVNKRWFQSFSIPGYSAYETNQRTFGIFHTGIRPPVVVVFHADSDVTTGANATAIKSAMVNAALVVPAVRYIGPCTGGF